MPYKLDSKILIEYLHERVYDPKFRGQRLVDTKISKDNTLLILTTFKKDTVVFRPSFIRGGFTEGRTHDKIEIEIEPQKAGVDSSDVTGFLEKLIKDDKIFDRGQPLFSYERQKELLRWREVLERNNNLKEHKMICLIKDTNISTEKLRKIIYEYMFRPCLYYLFNLGKFSS